MIAVVDTSALVMLFTARAEDQDEALAARLAQVIPHVPDVVDVEFHHALRALCLGRKVTPERAEVARSLYAATPLQRFPTQGLIDRIWSLRHNLGAYDASFVSLAEVLDVPLITCDEKQQRASGHQARIEAF